jgi:hypothetical protein
MIGPIKIMGLRFDITGGQLAGIFIKALASVAAI